MGTEQKAKGGSGERGKAGGGRWEGLFGQEKPAAPSLASVGVALSGTSYLDPSLWPLRRAFLLPLVSPPSFPQDQGVPISGARSTPSSHGPQGSPGL